jgi:hypothetical protein
VTSKVKDAVGCSGKRVGFAAVLAAAALFCAATGLTAGDFDPARSAFRVKFEDETTPYKVTGVFVLPGQRVKIEIPPGETPGACNLDADAGRTVERGRNRWTWEAPYEPGDLSVVLHCPQTEDSVVLQVFVMVPFDSLKDGYLNGYCIGEYPSVPLSMLPIYNPPKGFIEVTESNLCRQVSPHFQIGQFVCKQAGPYPKYVVLRERLVLKLELILEKFNEAGHGYDTFHIMSGYRTPSYNEAIGNVKYSRHLWGGAADIFPDGDLDGMMDDLNCDGRSDYRDADVLYDFIDRMYGRPWYERFLGGLAKYKKTSCHGPFVHVDVRGVRARWGD